MRIQDRREELMETARKSRNRPFNPQYAFTAKPLSENLWEIESLALPGCKAQADTLLDALKKFLIEETRWDKQKQTLK